MAEPQGFQYDKSGKVIPPSYYDKRGQPVYDEPRSWLDTAADVGRGVVKGAAHTLDTLGNLVPGHEWMDEKVFTPYQVELTPTNTPQQVGYAAEQIGEFMLPGNAPKKAAAWMATKAAPVFRNAPRFVQGAAELLPRMATEGATAGAITAAQGGDVATGAEVAAAMPVAGKVAAGLASKGKEVAKAQVSKFLEPTTRNLKYEARQLEEEILNRRIVGTQPGVHATAEKQMERARDAVKAQEARLAAAHPGPVVPTAGTINALDRQIARSTMRDPTGAQVPVPGKESVYHAAVKLKDFVNSFGSHWTVEQAAEFKRHEQAVVRIARAYSQDEPKQAQATVAKEAARAVRRAILRVNNTDDLKKAYDEFKFWAGLDNVLYETALRKRGQQGWGKKVLSGLMASGMGALAGTSGAGTVGGITAATVAGSFAIAVQTPTWKLASAQVKNMLADALTEGNLPKAKFLLDRIIKGTVSVSTQPSSKE